MEGFSGVLACEGSAPSPIRRGLKHPTSIGRRMASVGSAPSPIRRGLKQKADWNGYDYPQRERPLPD